MSPVRAAVLLGLALVLTTSCGPGTAGQSPSTTGPEPTTPEASATTTLPVVTTAHVDTTTTNPPTTTTSTPATTSTTLVPIDSLESGLFCRDLAAAGYSYVQAVAYWQSHGSPDRMDADHNTIPCQTVYPEETVLAFWGDPLPETIRDQFAYLVEIDAGPPMTLTVDFASLVYVGEPPEAPYRHINNSTRLRTYPIANDAVVVLASWRPPLGDECIRPTDELRQVTGLTIDHSWWGCVTGITELETVFRTEVDPASEESHGRLDFWLAITDGIITALEEQYVP